jgi:lactoylglutathione lyase
VPSEPLFRKVDAVEIAVPSVDDGLAFYRDGLGHELVWRTETAAGLRMPETDAEIVLQTERPESGVDLLVESADAAVDAIVAAGGRVVAVPFDIAIGRCAVVEDPWGNRLVVLDARNGRLQTDAEGRVIGLTVEGGPPRA